MGITMGSQSQAQKKEQVFFYLQRSCLGLLIFASGRLYFGQFAQDDKSQGLEIYPNGARYFGQFEGGKKNGKGKYNWPNKIEYYEGDWEDGYKHGQGVWLGLKGDKYEGGWKLGKPDGYGKHIWINGDIYEGEFAEGLKHGQGKDIFRNGDFYVGQYFKGRPHGIGAYQWQNGNYYEGQFSNGYRHGYGVWKQHFSELSDFYQGNYVNDKKEGQGTYTWKNGMVYQGMFQNDVKHGLGMLTDPNSNEQTKYSEWVNDQRKENKELRQIINPMKVEQKFQFIFQQISNQENIIEKPPVPSIPSAKKQSIITTPQINLQRKRSISKDRILTSNESASQIYPRDEANFRLNKKRTELPNSYIADSGIRILEAPKQLNQINNNARNRSKSNKSPSQRKQNISPNTEYKEEKERERNLIMKSPFRKRPRAKSLVGESHQSHSDFYQLLKDEIEKEKQKDTKVRISLQENSQKPPIFQRFIKTSTKPRVDLRSLPLPQNRKRYSSCHNNMNQQSQILLSPREKEKNNSKEKKPWKPSAILDKNWFTITKSNKIPHN